MAHSLYELDVRLKDIKPPIWRTLELPGTWTLEDVHFAIQIAMGWETSHLHQFKIGKKAYGIANEEDELGLEDQRRYRLQDVAKAGSTFVYEYDFGDGWEHEIKVKRVTSPAKQPAPKCTGGARACPPEDCGGPPGYANLLVALADPSHEDHDDLAEWAGDFEPEAFTVPADLADEIEALRLQVAGGDEDELEDIALPTALVEAILGLPPMQRASLCAVIAGSLANELLDAQAEPPPAKPRRK